jgi:hypothetical protein
MKRPHAVPLAFPEKFRKSAMRRTNERNDMKTSMNNNSHSKDYILNALSQMLETQ